jgi:acetylornithine deacetylase/succinyl-diaminopimelate desuccinylase-like protein
VSAVEAYLAEHADAALADLEAFCRIPSVSTDPAYIKGIRDAAGFVAGRLKRAGFGSVEIVETGGHPAVFGEIASGANRPTILVYGHYDVQPPDPLDKWMSPPFEPVVRDDRLYGRGVSDDKGPMLIPILVAEAFLKTTGRLPVNLKVLIEGEEESGSPHFAPLVERMRERLACDLVVSADGAMWRADTPSITVASRGLVALDVAVSGAAKDLHSGRNGGSAPNPIRVLAALLASLHDADGKVVVSGFHDGIVPPDPEILRTIDAIGFDTGAYFHEIGAPPPDPLPTGRELLVRQWLEPTLEFNGVFGGYSGPGTKTVIPSSAGAKITCRLVAGQDPDAVAQAIRRHIEARLPSGYAVDITDHGPGSRAFSIDPALPALATAETLLGELLGTKALRVAMGATVPIGAVFQRHLGAPVIFFSFSTSDEDYHAPNEFFRLSNFRLGQIAWARLLDRLGGPSSG